VVVRERSAFLIGLALALLALAIVGFVAMAFVTRRAAAPFFVLALFFGAFLKNCMSPSNETETLRASRRGLWVGDRFVSAARILDARRVTLPEGPALSFDVRRSYWPLEVIVTSDEQAKRILLALGRDQRPLPHDAVSRGEVAEEAIALERGELSFGTWIERLRALTEARATHRRAPLRPERLRAIVESPNAAPTLRAAAAVALGPGTPAFRVGDAPPKLRVAIELARNRGLEKDLEEALDELAREEELEVDSQRPPSSRGPRTSLI
jgi:hypothetical protein